MRYVVVTTSHRGVFFGLLESWDEDKKIAILQGARNCVMWGASTKGFLGLCNTGPLEGSRVGPACPRLVLVDVTSVGECTNEAVTQWESEPWND